MTSTPINEPIHQTSDVALTPARRIRSFVRRAGRTTAGQQRAIDALSDHYVLPFAPMSLDWQAVFENAAPVVLEIGFGMGETTAQIAQRRSQENFLGIEVHQPGVGALLKRIDALGLRNVRIIADDAVEVMEHMIAPGSLAGVHVFFPDPWHKKRHHKRRLLQAPFVAQLVKKLQPDGYLHCATDWEAYAEQILAVLSAEPALVNTASRYAERPDYRPVTKFEKRGVKLGHGVWDLVFKKI